VNIPLYRVTQGLIDKLQESHTGLTRKQTLALLVEKLTSKLNENNTLGIRNKEQVDELREWASKGYCESNCPGLGYENGIIDTLDWLEYESHPSLQFDSTDEPTA
jgi:hypothetical protein